MIELIDKNRLPKHIAIIMDGNGRWAKEQGYDRIFGHHSGVESVREITQLAAEIGIDYLTLYTFSTENWNRPKEEVDALMDLFVENIEREMPTFEKNKIRFVAVGDLSRLPAKAQERLQRATEETAKNERMTLVLALSYSSRWEITHAVQEIAAQVAAGTLRVDEIDEATIDANLSTQGIPDPDLLIRTSGEIRISNFLLWQLAYSELYFTDTPWPAFRENEFLKAIIDYQKRERRFGKTSEQLND